ncbi:polyketide transferase FFUJ_12241 [Colletotrichum spaethianum]|uniref:Polyketide transferase FFUJ_12241 n=1 Tax=Colletotrichum spaethianum TaxID=700344 RepID=A0AA37LCF4_9PEZI|nr:polyketide transferase FFUJ_12241 [Colletotrichum spaethianum]GKT45838.1 polyketide transferase FFUJ_12241 [Colletotrichum spaethianum]
MADSAPPRLDADIKTLDGITLRGWLFPAASRGPAMIMTPGFNFPKDANLPDIARWFQEHGITILLYDPRGIGASEGEPRNEVDPRQQIEDLHDAVTWIKQHPLVDETKIALWGLCWGGNVTLAATAFDKRVAATIAMAPMINTDGSPERRKPLLELAMHDRTSQLLEGQSPMYLPYIDEDGNMPNGQEMAPEIIPALDRLGIALENRISVQTYYKCLAWNLLHVVKYVAPTPAMMVTPELDETSPLDSQLHCFTQMGYPKELDILKGSGHLDWMFKDLEQILRRQFEFLKKYMEF